MHGVRLGGRGGAGRGSSIGKGRGRAEQGQE